jgi:hypothetical protein
MTRTVACVSRRRQWTGSTDRHRRLTGRYGIGQGAER